MSDPSEAAVEPPVLDIQHDTDPAHDHGPARRIPHLGHALLFFALTSFFVSLCVLVGLTAAHITSVAQALEHPGISLGAQGLGYLLTLGASFWLFPQLWNRSFPRGIEWNWLSLRRHWVIVLFAGIALSICAQTALHFVPTPTHTDIETLMQDRFGAWAALIFGITLAPLFEETAFRGFLLPALATAYDWLLLERTPAGLQRWQSSTAHSLAALVFGSIFCSIPFALLHASQLDYAWPVVTVLFFVSLFFCYLRLRLHSLACSVLLHATYNASLFAVALVATGGFQHLDKLH